MTKRLAVTKSMVFARHVTSWVALTVGLLTVLILAACSSATAAASGGATSSGNPTSGSAHVKTATAMVKGASTTILTDAQGRTLYYLTTDTATTSTCTGGCAATWPPLLTSGAPVADSALSGRLSSIADGNGIQVTYNGHPLYTYAGDSGPGQTNGEGVGGVWFVATPTIPANGGGAARTATSG